MKNHKNIPIVVLIVIILFSIYTIYNSDKYREIESTDLSTESIGGLSLGKKYSTADVEEKFGQLVNKNKKNGSYVYEHQLEGAILLLDVDKDNNIMQIEYEFGGTSITTDKGMTKVSTFSDIKKAYGTNFLEEEYDDFMGSRKCREITYVDKENMDKISFILYEFEDWNLGYVRLSRY